MSLDVKVYSYDANGKKTVTRTFKDIKTGESDTSAQRQLILRYAALTSADSTKADLIKTTEIDLS